MTQPGLIEGLPGGHEPLLDASDPRLERLLAHDASGLHTLLQGPRAHKLGIAFEALILWGLEQGLGYKCLARDIQIQDGKRTMGALDFVLKAPDGAIEHWELAYKLFLQCDDGLEWASWLGPRGRDRLDAKLHKMLTHQLPMSETPQAEATLKTLGVDCIDRHRLMMQGVLFTPWGKEPQRAVQGHKEAQGRWLRPSQLPDLVRAHPDTTWVQRHKPLWFGPASALAEHGMSSRQMQGVVEADELEFPQLWSQIVDENPSKQRLFFVVKGSWGLAPEDRSEATPDTK